MESAQFELKNFEKLAWIYQNEPAKYAQISAKELQSRVNKVNAMVAKFRELETTVRMATSSTGASSSIQGKQMSDDLEGKPLMAASHKLEDGEFAGTQGLSSKQVLQKQKDMLRDQDNHLDEIGGIVSNLRYENQNFNQEVTHQNKMLEKINNDIDRNQAKMVKVDTRLKNLIKSSNQCCLWCVIISEIVVLVLLLTVF